MYFLIVYLLRLSPERTTIEKDRGACQQTTRRTDRGAGRGQVEGRASVEQSKNSIPSKYISNTCIPRFGFRFSSDSDTEIQNTTPK